MRAQARRRASRGLVDGTAETEVEGERLAVEHPDIALELDGFRGQDVRDKDERVARADGVGLDARTARIEGGRHFYGNIDKDGLRFVVEEVFAVGAGEERHGDEERYEQGRYV